MNLNILWLPDSIFSKAHFAGGLVVRRGSATQIKLGSGSPEGRGLAQMLSSLAVSSRAAAINFVCRLDIILRQIAQSIFRFVLSLPAAQEGK